MPYGEVEDHDVLDKIADSLAAYSDSLGDNSTIVDVTRESECVEFTDTLTGKRYEIVVREIDGDTDQESPGASDP